MQLEFIVDDLPQAFAVPVSVTTYCDDEADPLYQDGIVDFDTTDFETTMLGGQTNMNVYYFDENNNPLPSPLPNPFRSGTQNVRVVVENRTNTDCTAEVILPFIVNPTPIIDLNERVLICYPDTQTTIDAHILDGTPISSYTYQWYLNGNPIAGANSGFYFPKESGVYQVEISDAIGWTGSTDTLTVTLASAAFTVLLFLTSLVFLYHLQIRSHHVNIITGSLLAGVSVNKKLILSGV